MADKYAVYSYMDVSTGHITAEDNEILMMPDSDLHIPGVAVYSVDQGFFMPICDRDENDVAARVDCPLSASFWKIIDKAHANGCVLVRLDSDGMGHPDLDEHNW